MFKQIVVGADEHEGGRDATALGKKLVATDGQLAVAFLDAGPYGYRGASAAFEVTERERTLERLEVKRAEAGVEAGVIYVGSTPVERGLQELAAYPGADLLVVGSYRRSLVGRVLIGDDNRAGLNGAVCAVAIAPAGYVNEPAVLREIGVGYDGSPESEHAILLGVPAARGSGTSGVFVPSRSRRASVGRSARADGPPVELRQECRYECGC